MTVHACRRPLAGRPRHGPPFTLPATPDQTALARRPARQAGDPGLLSRRLEPGLRRPDGAVQRDPAGVPAGSAPSWSASRSTASGATPPSPTRASCTFRCSPTSSRRARSRAATASIAPRRAPASARCSCIDARRRHPLELRLARRRQPRRGRHPRGARRLAPAASPKETDVMSRLIHARRSAQDHARGTGRRAGDAGRIRRLRVPVLRRGLSGPQGRAAEHGRRSCASSSATSRSRRCIPTRCTRPSSPRPRRESGKFWEAHDLLYEHQDALDATATSCLRRAGSGSTPRPCAAAFDGRFDQKIQRRLRGRRAQRRQRHADAVHQRVRYDGPRDAKSLVAALRHAARG